MFSGPIESKVQYASLWTLGGSVGVAILNAVAAHSELLGGLPALAQFVILAAIPPATTFLAGYVAPATPRPDLWNYDGPAQPWSPPLPTAVPVVDSPPLSHPPYQDEPYPPYGGGYEQPKHRRR